MRSLEFENDDLFNDPGRVYRDAAADITEYSNPLGELKITTDDYEYLHEVINDATSYNWTDDQYETLLTPLHKMVDAPLARFIEGVVDGDPRAESDRFNEQLVSILQNNYQRYGTEPRAAIDGVIMALQRGYSQAQNMWGDDVEIDESDDLFQPGGFSGILSQFEFPEDGDLGYIEGIGGSGSYGEEHTASGLVIVDRSSRQIAFIPDFTYFDGEPSQEDLEDIFWEDDPAYPTIREPLTPAVVKKFINLNESDDDDLFEPQTGGKYWSNTPPEYEQLYAELVPAQGPAETLEGELLRAASRLYYQYFNNGWMNNVSASENFLRNFAEPTPAMQRALHTIHPYTRTDVEDLENKQTARQVEIALDAILTTVIRQVQAANGNYHPNPGDMFDYDDPDDEVDQDDRWDNDGYEEPEYDEDDEDLDESDDDLFAAPGESGAAAKMRRQTERIVQTVEELVRLSMPDGDPIDYVFPYMLRKGLDMNQLEAILRMHGYQDIYAMRDEIMQSLDDENLDIQLENDDLFAPSERVKILHAIRGMRRGGDSNGTSLQGIVHTTYAQLLQTFGQPIFGPDERDYDKVTCEWVVTFGDGSVATIYDWKTGQGTPRGEYNWHIGGHRKVVAEYVRVALNLGRDAAVMEDDDDLFGHGMTTQAAFGQLKNQAIPINKRLSLYFKIKATEYQKIADELYGAGDDDNDLDLAAAYLDDAGSFQSVAQAFSYDLRQGLKAWRELDTILREETYKDLIERAGIDLVLIKFDLLNVQRRNLDEDDDLFEPRTGYIPPETVAKIMPTVNYFIQNLEDDEDMIRIQQEEPEGYTEIIRDFQGAAQELRRGNVIKALAYLENAPIHYDLDDWFYTVILRKTGIDLTQGYDSEDSRHEELFRKYQNEIRALKEYGMGGFQETQMREVREFAEWTHSVVEADRKKKTQTRTDQPGLDPNMFTPKMDQPLARQEPQQDQKTDQHRDIRRASAARTRQATAGITSTDQMSDMLSRLRNIEIDPNLEPYPDTEPETLPSVDVTTQNLPAVAGANMQAAGIQNPEFYQVAALPGNMAAMIRQLGKNLFGAMTSTPTNNIYVVANLGGQGPNTTQEVNAVAGYLRDHGVNIGPGDIDFSKIMPGYQAETNMFSAGGIRWLLVRDFAGQYIYAWPEADSVDYGAEPRKLR